MDDLLHTALERAFLHDDPLAYEAGVRAAFQVLLAAGLALPGGVVAARSAAAEAAA